MSGRRAAPVAGVVLAAGASTRMGRNKLLVSIDGQSVVRRAALCALAAHLEDVVVVVGHDAERVERELEGLACRTVVNAGYALGQAGSLRAGIAALPAATGAAVVMLADMPFVTAAMVASLVERWRSSAAPLVISDYQGVTAPPILYDASLFLEIAAMTADGCAKQIVRRHRGAALALSWPADTLADLDVPEDVARLRERVEAL